MVGENMWSEYTVYIIAKLQFITLQQHPQVSSIMFMTEDIKHHKT